MYVPHAFASELDEDKPEIYWCVLRNTGFTSTQRVPLLVWATSMWWASFWLTRDKSQDGLKRRCARTKGCSTRIFGPQSTTETSFSTFFVLLSLPALVVLAVDGSGLEGRRSGWWRRFGRSRWSLMVKGHARKADVSLRGAWYGLGRLEWLWRTKRKLNRKCDREGEARTRKDSIGRRGANRKRKPDRSSGSAITATIFRCKRARTQRKSRREVYVCKPA
jgi:hypothetical protein